MDEPALILRLADELLSLILSFLVAEIEPSERQDRLFAIHRSPSPPGGVRKGERSDLDRYRLVCKRFMRLATPWKFRRFVLRFSRAGFQRLDELIQMGMAQHVRYFTYMVRPYYQGGWDAYLQSLQASNRKLSDIHARRLAEQRTLIESHTDALSLRHAMRCFSSLQQIKLLRLQDESDEIVLEQVRRSHTSGNDGPRLDWELACTRAIMGLSTALLGTNLRCVRFLAPQLIPEAGLRLVHTPRGTMAAIAERLTSLDITLYSPQSLTPTLSTLSPVFRRFFQAARNLTSIHVGFSPTNPADVPLEQVFHHVHWERLRSLGIQGWRLTCLELIGIVRRHSACLEELRLPYVHLHQGSSGRWRDLLAVLHDEMNRLRRVDLRGINYYQNLDDEDDPDSKTTRLMMGEVLLCPGWPSSVCDCEHGGQPRQIPSTEQLRALGVDDLGDDGLHVEREHWTLWQAWLMATPRTEQVNGFAKLY